MTVREIIEQDLANLRANREMKRTAVVEASQFLKQLKADLQAQDGACQYAEGLLIRLDRAEAGDNGRQHRTADPIETQE